MMMIMSDDYSPRTIMPRPTAAEKNAKEDFDEHYKKGEIDWSKSKEQGLCISTMP